MPREARAARAGGNCPETDAGTANLLRQGKGDGCGHRLLRVEPGRQHRPSRPEQRQPQVGQVPLLRRKAQRQRHRRDRDDERRNVQRPAQHNARQVNDARTTRYL